MYNSAASSRSMYASEWFKETQGNRCNQCGGCMEKCPQKLPIPELLAKADSFLIEKQ
jgi:predicted aldo/keto reductase-like oxidoreductase